jgi:DHA1 family bicyclomycin/chloramphenicol resistance-like MFS transporter
MKLAGQNRAAAPRLATLVAAGAVGPLAMNIFLPSLPNMARYFEADYGVIQLLVSLYLVSTALIQLVIGPLSDRFGRRPILLGALTIFAASTLAAVYAPTVEALLACRLLQSTAAAGMVLSRAVIRDTVDSLEEAASSIGYVTMAVSVMPMVGPIVGGYLDELYGWKSTFLLAFAFGVVALLFVLVDLAETHHNRTSSMLAQARAYPELFRSREFWGYALTAGFASGAFFGFLGGGPFVATEQLHMQPSRYGLYFAFVSLGYLIGNFLTGRYSRRLGINRMMLAGNTVGMVGALLPLLMFAGGIFTPLSLFVPVGLIGVGNGMALPNANAGMLSVRPHLAGSAAGLGGTLLVGCGALAAFVAGALLTLESGPMPLLLVMLTSAVLGMLSSWYVIHVARSGTGSDSLPGAEP